MKKYLLIFVVIAGIMTGCNKEINLDDVMGGQSLGTGLALPIGTFNITLLDLYNSFDSLSELHFDEDNTIFLYWETPIAIDQFNVKDLTKGQKLVASYSLKDDATLGPLMNLLPDGLQMPLPEGSFVIADTLKYKFNFNEVTDTSTYYIDSVIISHAKLAFDLRIHGLTLDNNTFVEAELSFPTLQSVKPVEIKAMATTSHIDITRYLNNLKAEFERVGENSIDMNVVIKIVSDGTKSVTKDAGISLETGFEDLEYDAIFGYIYLKNPISSNHTTLTIPDSEMLSEFLGNNTVGLYNPEFSISLTTNLGIDAQLKVNELYSIKNGRKKPATFEGGSESFTRDLNRPLTPGDTATTTVTIDRNYGHLNDIFNEVPDSIVIDWDFFIGKAEPEYNNFIVDPIKLDANFSIRVPIWFDKGTSISLDDTIAADLTGMNGEWTDYLKINAFQIFLDFENTLPIHANASIIFLDEYNKMVFMTEDVDIPCPEIDDMGRSQGTAKNEIMLGFTHDEVPNIMKTKKIAIQLSLNGYDEDSTINFHTTDGIKVKVSAYANMDVTIPQNN